MSDDADDFVTFTHASGVFSIDIPASWSYHDDTQPGVALSSFTSPDGEILVRVAVQALLADNDEEAYVALLRLFVQGTSGSAAAFQLGEIAELDDDTLTVAYSYERDGRAYTGDAYIWADEPHVVLFLAAQPEDRYDELEDLIGDIGDSLAVEPEAPLPA
jgi:hypothetical protein